MWQGAAAGPAGARARAAGAHCLVGESEQRLGGRWKEKKEREGEAAGWDRLQREGTNWQAGLAEQIEIQN
jgi:hypothetical protein